MIEPVSAFSPRAVFRGSARRTQPTNAKTSQEKTNSEIAILNAIGTSVFAGGLTTIAARSYTSSWGHSGVVGLCASALTMLFIVPLLVENRSLLKRKNGEVENSLAKESVKTSTFKTPRRMILFKQA